METETETNGLDPFGVLELDEVQIRSSCYNLKMLDGTNSNLVLGDVLVSTLSYSVRYIHLTHYSSLAGILANFQLMSGR